MKPTLAAYQQARRLDRRAWSRLRGLAPDSEAFAIRSRRAVRISNRCHELYVARERGTTR